MDILKLYFEKDGSLIISLSWVVYLLLIIGIVFWLIRIYRKRKWGAKNLEFDSAEIGLKGSKIKIKPNYTNVQIAYQIWVELNTRKLGLPIDFENDVIIEIYKSWYAFFGITRNLIKDVPASKIRNDRDTKELINISTRILNEGLRPHLTKWNARFTTWYNNELEKNKDDYPQEIQLKYPKYDELKTDMEKVNKILISFKEKIHQLAFG